MLVLLPFLEYTCGIHFWDSDENAYAKYLECYDKDPSEEGRAAFSAAFLYLKQHKFDWTLDVTSRMDVPMARNLVLQNRMKKAEEGVEKKERDWWFGIGGSSSSDVVNFNKTNLPI